jgi:hypothetical protein
MTPQEAAERWPEDLYPVDSLGGMRRDTITRFWELAEEIAAVSDHPFVLDWLDAAAAGIAQSQDQLDEVQELGLRRVFKDTMGYDLPMRR